MIDRKGSVQTIDARIGEFQLFELTQSYSSNKFSHLPRVLKTVYEIDFENDKDDMRMFPNLRNTTTGGMYRAEDMNEISLKMKWDHQTVLKL